MAEHTPLVVVGDALLDRDVTGSARRLAPDAPVPVVEESGQRLRPGGAALAAYFAAAEGRDVTLVAPVGDDPASRLLLSLLAGRLTVVPLPLAGRLPEKTRVLAQDRPLLRLDRGDGRAAGSTPRAAEAIRDAPALLVADYGRGAADAVRPLLARRAPRTPMVWDPHPRGPAPVPHVRLVSPARAEARLFTASGSGPVPGATPASGNGPGTGAESGSGSGADAGAPATGADRPPSAVADDLHATTCDARALADRWHAGCVAVTLGSDGALLTLGGSPLLVPARPCRGGDACGAGDRFAATAAGRLADGALPEEAVRAAVSAAADYVAAGGPASLPDFAPAPAAYGAGTTDRPEPRDRTRPATTRPRPASAPAADAGSASYGAGSADHAGARDPEPAAAAEPRPGSHALPDLAPAPAPRPLRRDGAPYDNSAAHRAVEAVRAAGGTVVAAGGCFDLLHAGHVGLLQEARRIGDCLIVCLNSDASVHRLKGGGRPLNPLADRVRVLAALECVDAVAVFGEDTPGRLLTELRPDVWVKGGDYAHAELAEAPLLARWGGQAVLLPYLDGRSSTRLAARAAAAAARRAAS